MRIKKRLQLSIILLTSTLVILALYAKIDHVTVKAAPADSMWVEPQALTFKTDTTSVGDKFNVTIWMNVTSKDQFSWQFKLYYDTTQLNATRAGYTAGSTSAWATHSTGGGTVPITPVIEANYVWTGESLMGDYYVPAGTCDSLAWVEFQIIAAPPMGGQLTSLLDINNTDTYTLDSSGITEIPVTKYSATYTYTTDTTPPTISNPSQIPPADNVQPNQPVTVSVNVTDTQSGVKNVTLSYSINSGNWQSVPMTYNTTTSLWEAEIPGQPLNTNVTYKIEAFDNAENQAINDNAGNYFTYTVIPELTFAAIVLLLAVTSTVTIIAKKKFKK